MTSINLTRLSSLFWRQVVRQKKRMKVEILKLQEGDLEKQVAVAKNSLEKDNVIAVPTDTIYGIAAYAQSTDSINRIYDIKKRNYNKPIAICVGEVDDVYRWGKVTVCKDLLKDLLPGPVTLVFKRTRELNPDFNPGTKLIGIRIPDHQFIRELAKTCGKPIALTSANISSTKSPLAIEEFENIWPDLDLVCDDGTLGDTVESRLGSTVIDLSQQGKYKMIRQGCAYTPTVDVLRKYDLAETGL